MNDLLTEWMHSNLWKSKGFAVATPSRNSQRDKIVQRGRVDALRSKQINYLSSSDAYMRH